MKFSYSSYAESAPTAQTYCYLLRMLRILCHLVHWQYRALERQNVSVNANVLCSRQCLERIKACFLDN